MNHKAWCNEMALSLTLASLWKNAYPEVVLQAQVRH